MLSYLLPLLNNPKDQDTLKEQPITLIEHSDLILFKAVSSHTILFVVTQYNSPKYELRASRTQ